MFNSFTPFSYTAVLFAVSGIATVLILPKEPSSTEQRTSFLTAVRYLTNCAPPAHAPEFSRMFAARTCTMAGVGLTGVFLWYLVRFWVYGKAWYFTSAPLTIPADSSLPVWLWPH